MKNDERLSSHGRTLKEIAAFYGVSVKVMRSRMIQQGLWQKRRRGYVFMPRELKIIEDTFSPIHDGHQLNILF